MSKPRSPENYPPVARMPQVCRPITAQIPTSATITWTAISPPERLVTTVTATGRLRELLLQPAKHPLLRLRDSERRRSGHREYGRLGVKRAAARANGF